MQMKRKQQLNEWKKRVKQQITATKLKAPFDFADDQKEISTTASRGKKNVQIN